MRTLERRATALSDAMVSGGTAGRGNTLMRGRAVIYGALSEDLGGFREVFAPGSVRLADDLLVLFGHDTKAVLGRTSTGTACAFDDGLGIVFEVEPPDTTWARDLGVSMARGDIRQMSFAFRVNDDGYHYDAALGTIVRTVYAAEVSELSIVSMPAYEATQVSVT